jgi:hypothetical protein
MGRLKDKRFGKHYGSEPTYSFFVDEIFEKVVSFSI